MCTIDVARAATEFSGSSLDLGPVRCTEPIENSRLCCRVESDFAITFVCFTFERCAGNGQIGATYADSCHIHPIRGIVICQNRGVHVCTMGQEIGQQGGSQSCVRLVGNETSRKHIPGTGLSDLAGLGIGF